MIRSFRDKDTEAVYNGKKVKKWLSIQKQAEKRLQILDVADRLEDLKNLPSNRFESLKGDRKGEYSIRVDIQWRICFRWIDNEPHDVEMIDYH